LALLDKYSELCENPGFVPSNQHEFDNSADCRPRRLETNCICEDQKPLVEAHHTRVTMFRTDTRRHSLNGVQ